MSLAEADLACASAAVCPEIAVLRTKTVTGQIGQLVFLFMKNAKGREKYGLTRRENAVSVSQKDA